MSLPFESPDFFNEERYWLEKQPDMQPWEKGIADLKKKIQRKSASVCGTKGNGYPDDFPPRIWDCIACHWKEAANVDEKNRTFQKKIPVEQVIEKLVGRCDFKDPQKLDVDPFPEIVYTVHYMRNDEDAHQTMETQYKRYCVGAVRKAYCNMAHQSNVDEWWSLLRDHLMEIAEPNLNIPCINTYLGEQELIKWLALAARTSVRRYLREKPNEPQYPVDGDGKTIEFADVKTVAPDANIMEREKTLDEIRRELEKELKMGNHQDPEYMADILDKALWKLTPEEHYLFKAHYFDGVRQYELAAMMINKKTGKIGINPGNMARKMANIRNRVKTLCEEMIEADVKLEAQHIINEDINNGT